MGTVGSILSMEVNGLAGMPNITISPAPWLTIVAGPKHQQALQTLQLALGCMMEPDQLAAQVQPGSLYAVLTVTLANQGVNSVHTDRYGVTINLRRTILASGVSSMEILTQQGQYEQINYEQLQEILTAMKIHPENPLMIMPTEKIDLYMYETGPSEKYTQFIEIVGQLSGEIESRWYGLQRCCREYQAGVQVRREKRAKASTDVQQLEQKLNEYTSASEFILRAKRHLEWQDLTSQVEEVNDRIRRIDRRLEELERGVFLQHVDLLANRAEMARVADLKEQAETFKQELLTALEPYMQADLVPLNRTDITSQVERARELISSVDQEELERELARARQYVVDLRECHESMYNFVSKLEPMVRQVTEREERMKERFADFYRDPAVSATLDFDTPSSLCFSLSDKDTKEPLGIPTLEQRCLAALALLVSTWRESSVPFHVLGEFNSLLDCPATSTMLWGQLFHIATYKPNQQFIVFTNTAPSFFSNVQHENFRIIHIN